MTALEIIKLPRTMTSVLRSCKKFYKKLKSEEFSGNCFFEIIFYFLSIYCKIYIIPAFLKT